MLQRFFGPASCTGAGSKIPVMTFMYIIKKINLNPFQLKSGIMTANILLPNQTTSHQSNLN